jgi:threonyl-tRNA synthetase
LGAFSEKWQEQSVGVQIREAQLAQFNYILVVGEQEQSKKTVNVRTRDNKVHGEHALQHVIEIIRMERSSRSLVGLFGSKETAAATEAAGKLNAMHVGGQPAG